jgi:class 3 adenylate cyclase/tetratricopeptide (TPR) repeat protein
MVQPSDDDLALSITPVPTQTLSSELVGSSDRRLAAIASIDLFGYSRLTEQDEVGTHRALMGCRRKILEPIVERHRGWIVKSTGDGALIQFPNAVDAVQAMIRFQQDVMTAETAHPEQRRLVFRVGIHMAHAIVEGGDLYGHGVNLAVRLQETAEPGSILLSDIVVRHLPAETVVALDDVGNTTFKNIREQTRLYRWRDARCCQPLARYRPMAAAAIVLAFLAVPRATPEPTLPVGRDQGAFKPTESTSTARSTEQPMSISGAEFPQTGNAIDTFGAFGERLPPIYISEAVVPHDHKRRYVQLRVKGDPAGGYDWVRPFDELQAKGKRQPTLSAVPTLEADQRNLRSRKEIAEDAYIQALALYGRHTPSDLAEAAQELDQALMLCPDHRGADALLAAIYWAGWQNRWQVGVGLTVRETLNRARYHLSRAPKPDPLVHMVTSEMLTASARHGEAILEAGRIIERWPEQAIGYYAKGRALVFDGRPGGAEPLVRTAIRLDPHAPRYLFGLALAQFGMEQFDQALLTLTRATRRNAEDDWPFLLMAATHGHLGLRDKARLALGQFDHLSVPRRGWFATQIPYVHSWPFRHQRDRQRLHDGMILAGIPKPLDMASR